MTAHLDQTFGIEIECYLPDGATMRHAARALTARGIETQVEGYSHRTPTTWKIVTDASLRSIGSGMELVSPILTGQAGLDAVATACRALQDFGCTVNRSCGFHVHVGARGAQLGFFKNLVKLYAAYEAIIDRMMPVSRRGGSNRFCRSMTSVSTDAIDRAQTMSSVQLAAAPGADSLTRRYFKLNLQAFNRHNTVEFRQHSGTTDAEKATRWVLICLRMAHAAKRNDLPIHSQPATSLNQARPNTKAYRIGQMMLRPEGASADEVCAEMGWPSVSMPQQARICGLAYTTRRMGRRVRYYANRPAQTTAAIEITVEGFASIINADDTDRAYIARRVADLANGGIAWAA